MIAGASGKILLEHFQAQDVVREGDYIAVIQNSAHTADVRKIHSLLSHFNPIRKFCPMDADGFPETVVLGELSFKYFSFLTSLQNICRYEKENTYEKQKNNLRNYIKWQYALIEQTQKDSIVSDEKLGLFSKWLERNTGLYQKDYIHERAFDEIRTDYLNTQSENYQLKRNITTLHVQIAEAEGQLSLLEMEQVEKEQQMHMELVSSYNELFSSIKNWEESYVFKAPFDGRVEFLKFLTNNQFVQAGEELFSIVPEGSAMIGHMLLPAVGSGKVVPGAEVVIKLDNYPYMEYGSVHGAVSSMSLVTRKKDVSENLPDTYLIHIHLPKGLVTNYGKELDFRYEIKGNAEIIVNDRRLLERLFDNLRYRTR